MTTAKTQDGRTVKGIHDGDIWLVYVEEAPSSRYWVRTWCASRFASVELVGQIVAEIAANNGRPTDEMVAGVGSVARGG